MELKKVGEILKENYSLYLNPQFILAVMLSYAILLISSQISTYAGLMATHNATNHAQDIFFQILPRYNTEVIHSSLLNVTFTIRNILFLVFPRRIIFALTSVSLLLLTRAFFINLTHLGIPENANPVLSGGTFGGDLFFSGHVAIPFLLGLIYWDIKVLRYLFFSLSFIFGVAALLGRYHYSIDVFAAPFFAYGIFKLNQKMFKVTY